MLGCAIRGQAIQDLLGYVLEQVVRDLPEGLRPLGRRKGRVVRSLTVWAYVFLQIVQRFCQQDRNRLPRLMGEGDQQGFLFRRQLKRLRSHKLTIPRVPHICKASSERALRRALYAESRPPLLVPIERVVELGPGFRSQDDG